MNHRKRTHNFQAETTREKTDRNRWVPLRVEAWLGFIFFLSHDFVVTFFFFDHHGRKIAGHYHASWPIDLSLSLSLTPPSPPQMLALPATSCVLTFLPPPSPFFVFEISNRTHTAPIVDIFYSAHTFTSSLLFFFFSFLKDQSWRGFIGNRERIIYFSFFLFFSLSFESRHASPSILVWSRWI